MNRENTGSVGAGRWKGVALALLAVLAIGQSVVARQRVVRVAPAGSPVAVDDDVSGLMVRLSGGETFELGAGNGALLLVFDPDCAHTARVAEAWASWLADEDSGRRRTIAVSAGPLAVAVRYARNRGWNVRVGSIESAEGGVSEHPLTSRTPWVFAIGTDGRVVADGHGVRLAEVAQAIRGRRGGDQDGSSIIRGSIGLRGANQATARRDCTLLDWGLVSIMKGGVSGTAENPPANSPQHGRKGSTVAVRAGWLPSS